MLVSRGIGNNAEQEDTGTFSIWVHDDDQITEAARLFALFRTSPDAPEFRDATAAAKVIRAQLVKSEKRRRSTVADEARVGYERNFAGGGMITILLVVLTVAITVYAGFMRSSSVDRAVIDRL